ncbi:FAD-binding oxidoreductase [Mycolicibacterium tokaiense]|uniref:Benzoate 1,2-dioxygenase electron transfer component n=1 Tax=Mycolicibacterium tokaiense TaxID=39695 RepID=A0A378TA48_9MYCO|nr:FAD-binding oxidoreductase [Mycolicibacterium tokaiense]BBY88153.1 oxidoreductase [Mycolicibacterium tokaiense]STZ57324.1 benzoate 1,2-dioxygenase electron transfer component [Mycolicibacterium tokaiense]
MSATWYTATVADSRRATPDGALLTLHVPGWPGSLAGQHVDVRLTAEDGYQAVRSYSLASYGPAQQVELAVDRLPDGEVSPYLVDDVRPGDQMEIRGPIGGYFVWRPTQSEAVQLIAGGSGVVPLTAMVRAHRDSGSTAQMRLFYSVRTREHAYFADELAATDGVQVHWQYTATAGRINAAAVAAHTIGAPLRPSVYVCGSTGFVERAASLLVSAGHDPMRIRTERYGGT